jgi:hypothetical protein
MNFMPVLTVNVRTDFTSNFLEESSCRTWVLNVLHPNGIFCPKCKTEITDNSRKSRFWLNQRITCPKCAKLFSALTDTYLSGSHLDFNQIVLLSLLLAFGIPFPEIARMIGQDPETVRLYNRKFTVLAHLNELGRGEQSDA